jgi:FG-GAP repeat
VEPWLKVAAGDPYSLLGRAVVLGQLDADGLPDLVVGAPGAGTAGCVYVYLGKGN